MRLFSKQFRREDNQEQTLNALQQYHLYALMAQNVKDSVAYISALWGMCLTICGEFTEDEDRNFRAALDRLESLLFAEKDLTPKEETEVFMRIRDLHWALSRVLREKGISLMRKTDPFISITQRSDL